MLVVARPDGEEPELIDIPVADLRNDPHLRSAGFWRDEQHPSLGALSGPGAPFRVDHDWWRWASAPPLGADTAAVLAGT